MYNAIKKQTGVPYKINPFESIFLALQAKKSNNNNNYIIYNT
jgi:hypothetical protein